MIENLIEKHAAEEVGGRFIAVVNGKREYIANRTAGGGLELTFAGQVLAEQDAAEPPVQKKARNPRKVKVENDPGEDLDAAINAELGESEQPGE